MFLYYIVYIQSKVSIISFQRIFLWISFHKKPICHARHTLKQAEKFYNSCNGAICSLLPILNYGDALSELKFKKSYAVYILEKYIHLLQFAKYIMLRSLLKYVLKGFEKLLRYYVIFKTLNFMYMSFPGSFHRTSDVISDL